MRNSKLTSKFQATIPRDIRSILKLNAGDKIIFEVTEEKQIFIRKALPKDIAYLQALGSTLSEWNSKNDDEDFRDL